MPSDTRNVDVVFRFARDSPLEESGFEPSVPLLRRGLPGVAEGRSRNEWGPVLSSGPLARWRLAARPLRGPVHGETEISNLVCSGRKSGTFATARSGRHRSSKQPSSRSPSTIALPIPNQPGNRERGGGRRSRYRRYAERARATAPFPSSGSAMVLRPASRPRSADAGEQGQDQGR